ncbi:hypothetical protein LDENG_00247520 [Lucifuga dentata]|nr:hypothetical protein LDENG_00247520 [Lucifuga dentata]
MLSRGLPVRHHVVSYLLLHSSLTHLQLQAALRPAPAEVSACLWADAPLVRAIVAAVDGEDGEVLWADAPLVRAIVAAVDGEDGEVRHDDLPTSVAVSEVSADSALSASMLPLSVLLSRAPVSGPDLERVSTGTKFSLELWLRRLETSDL